MRNFLFYGMLAFLFCPQFPAQTPLGPKEGCNNSTVDAWGKQAADKARAFLAQLKSAVAADDEERIASMLLYPVRVHGLGGVNKISNPAEFRRLYREIFTAAFKNLIKSEVPNCLFGNWQGVMIGDGSVWYQIDQHGNYKIITFNLDDPRPRIKRQPVAQLERTTRGHSCQLGTRGNPGKLPDSLRVSMLFWGQFMPGNSITILAEVNRPTII